MLSKHYTRGKVFKQGRSEMNHLKRKEKKRNEPPNLVAVIFV